MKTCFLVRFPLLVYKQLQLTHRLNLYFSRMFVFYKLRSKRLAPSLLQLNIYTCGLWFKYLEKNYLRENYLEKNCKNKKILCLKLYKLMLSLTLCVFCMFAVGFLRLRLVPKKGGRYIAQHRILMDDAFAQWLLQNKTCVPGMPKAGSFASCWKR